MWKDYSCHLVKHRFSKYATDLGPTLQCPLKVKDDDVVHMVKGSINWANAWDFHQCGILTCVDSDDPLQPPFKPWNSKWCSVSSLTKATSKGSDQTARMRRLIWGFAGRKYQIVGNFKHWLNYCNCSMFCFALLFVHSSFAIILIGKREMVVFLSLSFWARNDNASLELR